MPNCKDCKGSGEYQGLMKSEACRTCGGSGIEPSANQRWAAQQERRARAQDDHRSRDHRAEPGVIQGRGCDSPVGFLQVDGAEPIPVASIEYTAAEADAAERAYNSANPLPIEPVSMDPQKYAAKLGIPAELVSAANESAASNAGLLERGFENALDKVGRASRKEYGDSLERVQRNAGTVADHKLLGLVCPKCGGEWGRSPRKSTPDIAACRKCFHTGPFYQAVEESWLLLGNPHASPPGGSIVGLTASTGLTGTPPLAMGAEAMKAMEEVMKANRDAGLNRCQLWAPLGPMPTIPPMTREQLDEVKLKFAARYGGLDKPLTMEQIAPRHPWEGMPFDRYRPKAYPQHKPGAVERGEGPVDTLRIRDRMNSGRSCVIAVLQADILMASGSRVEMGGRRPVFLEVIADSENARKLIEYLEKEPLHRLRQLETMSDSLSLCGAIVRGASVPHPTAPNTGRVLFECLTETAEQPVVPSQAGALDETRFRRVSRYSAEQPPSNNP